MNAKHPCLRISALLLALLLLCCGCTGPQEEPEPDVLSIYASFYPLYALTEPLLESVEDQRLNCLVQPQDGCLRSYSLSDWDLTLLARSADLVIAGGRGLESFESVLYALGDNGPAVAAVLNELELKNFTAMNVSSDSESHWNDENPHIYLTVAGAREILNRIAGVISILDEKNEAVYTENLQKALNRLESVDNCIVKSSASASETEVIVMNEAFCYAAEEYGLKIALCYARESGTDMGENELNSCMEQFARTGAKLILIEKQAPQKLVNALKEAGFTLACLDTLSTGRAGEGFEGYLRTLEENARTVHEAIAGAFPAK